MAMPDVLAVVGSVQNLAVQETTLLCGVMDEVGFLKEELQRLVGFLEDADAKRGSGNGCISVWIRQIRDAAFNAKNIIEIADYMEKWNRLKKGFMGAISRYANLPSDMITLHNVGVEIQRVRRKITEICESARRLRIVDLGNVSVETGHVEHDSSQDRSLIHESFEEEDFVVGFQDEYKEIVDKLVDQEKNLTIVSIVGMGGIGKTTLARKVYNSPAIKDHFGKVAWITVSQNFQAIDLLRNIMKQIMGARNESRDVDQMQEYEVRKKIRNFLLHERYLIVLDDVWTTNTWEQINKRVKVFPHSNNGSRVLLTTRKADVANQIQVPTYIHNVKHLNDEKSWELFCSKALPSYRTSMICDMSEFEELGRKIAKKCNGLPLALAVLGGYLSKNLNIEAWSDALSGWTSTKDGQMMGDILARSYDDLPNHYLKSCFQYFAALPEDYLIYVPDLTELWIAEGFIQHKARHRLEETARRYVTELAQRSLIQVVHRSRVHGRIEKVRIHDILHEWCISKAEKDGFLDVLGKASGQTGASSSNAVISCRTSFQNFCDDETLRTMISLRTLFCFEVPSISLKNLRFLRVLHVQNSILNNFSSTVAGLIHLRCLRLRKCKQVILPSSIGQLLFLQTVDLSNTPLPLGVPCSMWDIPSLWHVYLGARFSPPWNRKQKGIQTLSLNIPDGTHIRSGLAKLLSQMTRLGTFHLGMRPIPAEMIQVLSKMSLVVEVYLNRFKVLNNLPDNRFFPQSLRELVLIADVIKEDPMPILEKLPCLMVLRLEGYEGRTMSCSANGFQRLQELELKLFSIEEWRISIPSMPKLCYLTLRWCEHIHRLPNGLLHLPSLKELNLESMRQIFSNEYTYKELQKKGCKVTKHL